MTSSSSPSMHKPTLLTSIRRFTPKLKRESMPGEAPSFHVIEASSSPLFRVTTSTSSSSRSKYPVTLTMAHESQISSTPTDESSSASSSVYCPPLAQPPSPPSKRRVRMSGSRLPSGYRPRPTDSPISPSPSSTHTGDSAPVYPQPGPPSPPASEIPQPLRTRLTRFLHRHTAPSSFTMTTTTANSAVTPLTTPTSSILSFPSSSSRTTTTHPSTPASSPTGSRKHVRFSTQRVKEEKRARSPERALEGGGEKERAHLSDAFARIGSPWRRSINSTHEGRAS